MIHRFTALALLVLVPSAHGSSDVLLKLDGFVDAGTSTVTGPFAGAQIGDPFTLLVELEDEFAGPFGVGTVLYSFAGLRLRIGAATMELGADPSMVWPVGNDADFPGFPQVDYIYGVSTLSPGLNLDILVEDAAGQLLSSNQLTTQGGVYLLSSGSGISLSDSSTGGGLELVPDILEIIPSAQVGAPFCVPAVPNSTGLPGRLTAAGYSLAEANGLRIAGEDLPPGATTLLLSSLIQVAPFPIQNSQGLLCIGLPIGRYVGLVTAASPSGGVTFPLDLQRTPTPTGFVAASAGQTWSFQAWHRDTSPQGAASNVTTGIAVTLR